MAAKPSILRNMTQLGLAQALTMALALVLKVYLPRALGLEKSGLIFFAESLILLYFSFLPLGIAIFIYREVPKNPQRARNIVKPILWVELALFLLVLGAMLLQLHLQGQSFETKTFIGIFALGNFCGVLCFQIFKPLLLSLHQVSFVATVETLSKALLTVTLVTILIFSTSLSLLAWGFLGAMLLTLAVYLKKLRREGLWAGQINRAFFQDILIQPLPYFIHGALAGVYMNMDMALLGSWSNAAESGLYGAALRLVGIFLLFIPLLSSSVMPVLSQLFAHDGEAYRRLLAKVFRLTLALSAMLVFLLVLFAEECIRLLYGNEFTPSVGALQLLSPTLTLTYCNVLLSQHLTLVSSGRQLILVTSLSIALDLALNSFLITWGLGYWGLGGAGMGVAITAVLSEVFVFLAFSYLSKDYLIGSKLNLRMLLIALPLCVLIVLSHGTSWALWWRCGLALICVPGGIFALRLITPADVRELKTKIQKRFAARGTKSKPTIL